MKEPLDLFLLRYVNEVTAILEEKIHGIYVYGSIALEAFEEAHSDIDIIVVVKHQLTKAQAKQLAHVHKRLVKEEHYGKRLDGMFITLEHLGKNEACYYTYNGKVKFGHWDTNAITWWLLKHKGVTLYGPFAHSLPLEVEWSHVQATLQYNLHSYWAMQTKKVFAFWRTEDVVFAVTTMARIYASYVKQEIVSKKEALQWLSQHARTEWQPLFVEVEDKLQGGKLPFVRLARMRLCRNFMKQALKGAASQESLVIV